MQVVFEEDVFCEEFEKDFLKYMKRPLRSTKPREISLEPAVGAPEGPPEGPVEGPPGGTPEGPPEGCSLRRTQYQMPPQDSLWGPPALPSGSIFVGLPRGPFIERREGPSLGPPLHQEVHGEGRLPRSSSRAVVPPDGGLQKEGGPQQGAPTRGRLRRRGPPGPPHHQEPSPEAGHWGPPGVPPEGPPCKGRRPRSGVCNGGCKEGCDFVCSDWTGEKYRENLPWSYHLEIEEKDEGKPPMRRQEPSETPPQISTKDEEDLRLQRKNPKP